MGISLLARVAHRIGTKKNETTYEVQVNSATSLPLFSDNTFQCIWLYVYGTQYVHYIKSSTQQNCNCMHTNKVKFAQNYSEGR